MSRATPESVPDDTTDQAMPLSQDAWDTVARRVAQDPAFAQALRDEVAALWRNGELEAARFLQLKNGLA